MKQRVVVTGLGVVAPNGVGKEAFWQALTDGLSGVRTIRRFDTSPYLSRIGGELADFDFKRFFDAREIKKADLSSLYAIAAALMALQDSRLDLEREDRERIGSCIGNAVGGVDYAEREIDVLNERGPHWTSPYLATAFFPCATNGLLSIRLGLKGIVLTFCNGNTSGTDAIGMAYRALQSGRADVLFAGGAEAPLVPLFLGSLAKDGFLSTRNADPEKATRPFDLDADGMVLGEGAALLVMESLEHAQSRGAPIYGEIIGYASGNSAFDVLKPDTNGHGLVSTIRRTLGEAGLQPGDVDVVHAQGLSMPAYDDMELRCFSETFGAHGLQPPVAAVSSWTGNSLGALGAVQGAASLLMLERQAVPAVANIQSSSSSWPANVVRKTRVGGRTEIILQTSYCFLGKSSTLLFKRWHP
jgi:3-oxoacyl-[acyl-carrier-protein] synthase II